MKTINASEFEDFKSPPDARLAGPTVTMLATMLSLVFMLCACSPPAQAQDFFPETGERIESPALRAADYTESFTVTPSYDQATVAKDRWQRFRDALDAGSSRGYRVVERATNDGVRTACYEPCAINCCASSGEFSLAGARFGR